MKKYLFILILAYGCATTAPLPSPQPQPTAKKDTVWITKTVTILDTMYIQNSTGAVDCSANAKMDGVSDDYAVLQKNIDAGIAAGATSFYIPSNVVISKGLLFRNPSGGFLVNIHIFSDGTGYGKHFIKCTDSSWFAIDLEKVKGARVDGLTIVGPNTIVNNYSQYDILNNQAATFVTPGLSNDPLKPNCGFAVDGIGGGGKGGSTDIVFKDCRASNFVVDYAISLNGNTQNAEAIKILDSWGDYCKAAIATGQSQSRSVYVHNFKSWGQLKTVFDHANYGNGTACPVEADGVNIAGGARYLCELGQWYSKGLNVNNPHIESLYSLGGCFKGPSNSLSIEGGWINIAGQQPGITPCVTLVQVSDLKIKNCVLSQYGASEYLPFSIFCMRADFQDDDLDFIPINNYAASHTTFRNCMASGSVFGDGENIGGVGPANLGTTKQLFTTGMECRYSILPTVRKKVYSNPQWFKEIVFTNQMSAGDVVCHTVKDEFGNNVVSAYKIASSTDALGTDQVYQNEYLIPQLVLGDVQAGSNQITGVVIEGGLGFRTDVPLFMDELIPGTKILSYDGAKGVITLSMPALVTAKNVTVLSAHWRGETYGTPDPNNPYSIGFKKGDIIFNEDSKWICTQSGITSSSRLPQFAKQ